MPTEPLQALSQKLKSLGIPSLGILIARLMEAEEYEDFVSLIREFLPEREEDILHNPSPARQVSQFASYFEDRYFPLEENFKMGDIEGYADLTRGIPIIPRGLSYDDYHSIPEENWRLGIQLLTYLVESPYDEAIALAEACEGHLSRELLQQVKGFDLGFLRQALKDTPYQGLARWAEIIWRDTGNYFLDTSYDDLGIEGLPFWSKSEVEQLTQEWQQADLIEREILHLAEWLEEDPPARFEELVNFILERR